MADAGKMDRVKEGLAAFVDRLRPSDEVALVSYSDDARVERGSQRVGDGRWLRDAIAGLQPGGATNLHAGLMLGLEQVDRHRCREGSNRVILLTDGIANRGETDSEAILRAALPLTGSGIDLSTIGVGRDVNTPLLDRLARGGRGLFHFVADAQDTTKVFVSELASLIAPVARAARLRLRIPDGLELERVYGHAWRGADGDRGGDELSIELPDLNRGATAVVMAAFRCRSDRDLGRELEVRARLEFRDAGSGRPESLEAGASVRCDERPREMLADAEVRKNFTIAALAQALHEMAGCAEDQRWADADRGLRRALEQARSCFPSGDDQDVERVRAMAEGHLRTLQQFVDRFGDR
jgi:Ca-activated chloride channel family protein